MSRIGFPDPPLASDEDLASDYAFDYSKARPNRFAAAVQPSTPARKIDDGIQVPNGAPSVDSSLLAQFMEGFYGYGSYLAKTWLIGMEEGGGNSAGEIRARLESWVAGGKRELEDVFEFHRRTGRPELHKWFDPSPPIQSTWGKLIKIILYSKGKAVTADTVRRFQSRELARLGGQTSLIELLPLPSPGKNVWSYDAWTALPELANRRTYEAAWKTKRSNHIRQRIEEHEPQLVLFYGGGDRRVWEGVIGQELRPAFNSKVHVARIGPSVCAFMSLPLAISENDLQKVGRTLAEHLTLR